MDKDLFGGEYVLPPEKRLLARFCVRLTPKQKERFAEFAQAQKKDPSELLREYVISLVGE